MTVQITYEQLVDTVVREVLAELARRGVEVRGIPGTAPGSAPGVKADATVEIDMTGFKTPVLTEGQLTRLPRTVAEVVVPCSTVITPGAWDTIRTRKLKLVRKKPSQ